MKAALQGAENAVAQVVVALAQVQAPVAMLKAKSSNPDEADTLLQEVERLADITMNVYQEAVLATADDVIIAAAAVTQAVAILTQMRVNLTVAMAQLIVMQEAQTSGGGPNDTIMAQAATARRRAFTHVEAAQKQAEVAMRAARAIEQSLDPGERRQVLQVVSDAKRAIQAHAMSASAYVLVTLAHATNQDRAVAATHEAAKAAEALLHAIQNGPQNAQTAEEIQVALVRARLARAVTFVAMANSDITGVAAPDVARQAAKVVKKRVLRVLRATRRAAGAAASEAHIIAVIARADALAASAASRIADAYVRLAIAQATEKTSNTALAARIAAADQLQNAVTLAREADAEASLTTKARAAANINTIHEAALRTESRTYLGAAWTQSATAWAYAAWAWNQGLTEVAEAAEAAAIATESAATMVEATVGAVDTSAPVALDLPMDISSLALANLSPSETATQVAEQAATPPVETPTESLPATLPVGSSPLIDNALPLDGTLRPTFTGVASPSR